MRIQGCQMQPASTYDEASWRSQAVTRVHDQVRWLKHTGTSNIKEMTVNPTSSITMNLNRKTCMKNGIESIGTHKHAINILNM